MILGFYGDGKGKTSAALGTLMRALGAGKAARAVFFMKQWSTSETSFLDTLIDTGFNAKYYQAGDDEFVHSSDAISQEDAQKTLKFGTVGEKDDNDMNQARQGLAMAHTYLGEKPFLLVLDEIGVAVHFDLLATEDVLSLINAANKAGAHVVLTGKKLSETLRNACDLITELKNERHPFQKGTYAIPGLDY